MRAQVLGPSIHHHVKRWQVTLKKWDAEEARNLHILCALALNVKHVDEHRDVSKDVIPLRLEIRLHVCLLPSAVPQVQHHVS